MKKRKLKRKMKRKPKQKALDVITAGLVLMAAVAAAAVVAQVLKENKANLNKGQKL